MSAKYIIQRFAAGSDKLFSLPGALLTIGRRAAILLAAFSLTTGLAPAANLLSNGDFSSPNSTAAATDWVNGSTGGWVDHKILDNVISHGHDNTGIYDGTYAMQLGVFNTTAESSVYQVVGGGPNASYTLTCDAGAEAWWLPIGQIKLIFENASHVELTNYVVRTTDSVHNPDLYDIGVVMQRWTNSAVSPAGTAFVKVELVGGAVSAGGNCWFDNVSLTSPLVPPVIADIYPNGAVLQQATNKLSFTATSALSITNVVLILNGVNVSSNLLITGPLTSRTVSYTNLQPNTVYTAAITVTDAGNLSAPATVSFDTFAPIVSWEAEDYDYSNGLFMDNPPVDAFDNLVGVQGVDYNDVNSSGGKVYRPLDNQSTEVTSDTPRVQYLSPATNDYALGWFVQTEWVNYTRTFPAGTYNIYGRFATGGGQGVQSLSMVTNGAGTSTQEVQPIGSFTTDNTGGWGTFKYFPLRDVDGNIVSVTLNGQTTLKLQRTTGQDANVNFFMVVPAVIGLPTITQVTPTGWMQSTNKLKFVASSGAGIATSNVTVMLNGVTVPNLAFTGSATSWNVSCPLAPNVVYTAVITVTGNNAQVATTTVSFDTMSASSYTWEVEDYDYSGGLFYDNLPVNQYLGLAGTSGIDFFKAGGGGSPTYRADAVATEACGDLVRAQYSSATDYNVGYTGTGDWWNYTRTFPAGKFNVYLRAARGSGGTAAMGLQQVTSGWGTTTQTAASLGSFTIPDTTGWQSYRWVPLKDGNGSLAVVTLGGTNTLRLTDGGANLNFLMIAPAAVLDALGSGGNLNLSFGSQSGFTYTVQYKDNLAGGTWTDLSTVAGDGTVKTATDSMTGPGRYYRLQIH